MKNWKLWVRWAAIVIFALAIPLCAFAGAGFVIGALSGRPPRPIPWQAFVLLGLSALLIWRIWLNLRVMSGPGAPRPTGATIPYAALALAGTVLIACGISFAALVVWSFWGAETALRDLAPIERALSSIVGGVLGFALAGLGALMTMPFVRHVRRSAL